MCWSARESRVLKRVERRTKSPQPSEGYTALGWSSGKPNGSNDSYVDKKELCATPRPRVPLRAALGDGTPWLGLPRARESEVKARELLEIIGKGVALFLPPFVKVDVFKQVTK